MAKPSKTPARRPAGRPSKTVPPRQAAGRRGASGRTPAGKSPRRRGGGGARGRRGWSGRLLRLAIKGVAVAAVWATVGVLGVLAWYATDLPDPEDAFRATRRPMVRLVAADGATLATFGDLHGRPLTVAEMPPALPQAVLATEDRRFYDHVGIDLVGLARAMVRNLLAGRVVQGGSTLTQQVAKNLFLTPERTFGRKVRELLLALWLERKFTKDQILSVYLNRVYLGAGTFGMDAAARRYFGVSARDVTLWQAATLAGLLKAPSRYNPEADPEAAAGRTRQVLANMVAAGYLGEAQAEAAAAAIDYRVAGRDRGGQARHFANWVMERVPDFVTPGDRDLVVATTLDPRRQRLAERAVARVLDGPGRAAGASEAALVALSLDGAVLAMVGGRDARRSPFNRAVQARRQPGSAFKPFVYLAALEAGLTPQTVRDDAPVSIGEWKPGNFDGRYRGPVSLRTALAESLNTVAVRVAREVGVGRVAAAARRLGIESPLDRSPSLALGTEEVSLLELTAAYVPIANGGVGVWPHGVEAVSDGAGRRLWARHGGGPGRVAEPGPVAALDGMLRAVITDGTGRAAALDRPAAGKTGTSQGFRDAWFIGYAGDVVAGVWMGNDDGRPMDKVTGGGLPARLWQAFMAGAAGR